MLKLAAGSAAGDSALWGLLAQFYRHAPWRNNVQNISSLMRAAAPRTYHVTLPDQKVLCWLCKAPGLGWTTSISMQKARIVQRTLTEHRVHF